MRKVNNLGIWHNDNICTTWESCVLALFPMTVGTLIVMSLKTRENNSLACSKTWEYVEAGG